VLLSTPNSWLIEGTLRPLSSNPCACANTSGDGGQLNIEALAR
jgi:hypothetical protein